MKLQRAVNTLLSRGSLDKRPRENLQCTNPADLLFLMGSSDSAREADWDLHISHWSDVDALHTLENSPLHCLEEDQVPYWVDGIRNHIKVRINTLFLLSGILILFKDLQGIHRLYKSPVCNRY
ncbi:hypothetical protein DV515_00001432 [Chloebia gouldiae]|uniref:Uncharacterized protein n=1 Tax=Chloebia gouldiae TaxID=44316 RepID=A0A3L8SY34_CHLGU|nr:hypothetical protein DV515_00001432 [Chloebia gouldiae]